MLPMSYPDPSIKIQMLQLESSYLIQRKTEKFMMNSKDDITIFFSEPDPKELQLDYTKLAPFTIHYSNK